MRSVSLGALAASMAFVVFYERDIPQDVIARTKDIHGGKLFMFQDDPKERFTERDLGVIGTGKAFSERSCRITEQPICQRVSKLRLLLIPSFSSGIIKRRMEDNQRVERMNLGSMKREGSKSLGLACLCATLVGMGGPKLPDDHDPDSSTPDTRRPGQGCSFTKVGFPEACGFSGIGFVGQPGLRAKTEESELRAIAPQAQPDDIGGSVNKEGSEKPTTQKVCFEGSAPKDVVMAACDDLDPSISTAAVVSSPRDDSVSSVRTTSANSWQGGAQDNPVNSHAQTEEQTATNVFATEKRRGMLVRELFRLLDGSGEVAPERRVHVKFGELGMVSLVAPGAKIQFAVHAQDECRSAKFLEFLLSDARKLRDGCYLEVEPESHGIFSKVMRVCSDKHEVLCKVGFVENGSSASSVEYDSPESKYITSW